MLYILNTMCSKYIQINRGGGGLVCVCGGGGSDHIDVTTNSKFHVDYFVNLSKFQFLSSNETLKEFFKTNRYACMW